MRAIKPWWQTEDLVVEIAALHFAKYVHECDEEIPDEEVRAELREIALVCDRHLKLKRNARRLNEILDAGMRAMHAEVGRLERLDLILNPETYLPFIKDAKSNASALLGMIPKDPP